uniref:Uncharacterized protein LOC102805120 n=1 Tax=Saccoglossus kowalevskii TaxID=10224 RepID=A0ABM0M683_SACKO|nr:PREDICTED: uncharacterized protein LOC102805120 [Saccoglossus kowalevskii]
MDMKNFHHVIHYGAIFDIELYVQEFGRNDKPSHSVILYHTNVCRRVKLYEDFASLEINQLKNKVLYHSCCDICVSKCSCGHGKDGSSYIERHLIHYCADSDSVSSDSIESDAKIENSSSSTGTED